KAPSQVMIQQLCALEREPQCKLQLTHCGVCFDICDLAVVTAAVDTPAATLIAIKTQHGVIEQVECIHAELSIELLGDLEILHHRHVRSERVRPVERVTANVTYGSTCRTSEARTRRWCHRTEVRARRGGDGQSTRNWSEERDDVVDGIKGTRAHLE